MIKKERVLVIVKTYPVISTKYREIVCTAGIREDGSWIRLYPITFRSLSKDIQYKKYQWIEVDVEKNQSDNRPESYRVVDVDGIKPLKEVDTARGWEERRKLVLEGAEVYTNLSELIELANDNKISIAVFKPTKIKNFKCKDDDINWGQDKINAVKDELRQANLFKDQIPEDYKIVRKVPKKFYYVFQDDSGKKSTMMIGDWEIGRLYWRCKGDVSKVREKYFDDFAHKKDLYFFLGTTWERHFRKARNPFTIIGVFYPPKPKQPNQKQLDLDLF